MRTCRNQTQCHQELIIIKNNIVISIAIIIKNNIIITIKNTVAISITIITRSVELATKVQDVFCSCKLVAVAIIIAGGCYK